VPGTSQVFKVEKLKRSIMEKRKGLIDYLKPVDKKNTIIIYLEKHANIFLIERKNTSPEKN
jgi:hypothetical protein